ncbi:MAG: adenylate/guanylate cyclase domain-containing protein, partial [Acidimicrobiia bacterium]|nr:adenylate/guanylate cyclase domain-containing protein [Acidimicrobiia bacterium]
MTLVAKNPTVWDTYDFWPVWVALGWGAVIVIHLGVVLAVGVFGRRARRRRKELAREARRAARELHHQARAAKRARHQGHSHEFEHGGHEGATPAQAGRAGQSGQAGQAGQAGQQARSSGPARKWVTVMFTDIANSTRLTEDLGDDEWSRILSSHRDLVRNLFVAHGGDVVGTQGDGCLGRFPTPAEAVLCAVEVQREIAQTRADTKFPMQIRIGIHAGEAV